MTNDIMNLGKLHKAKSVFERFRTNMHDDCDQAGAIRIFVCCYELAWKSMKRFLGLRGLETGSPKDTFRKAALEKLIDDPEIWFEFQKKRNLTIHVYEQVIMEEILTIFDCFSKKLAQLIGHLESMSKTSPRFLQGSLKCF